MNQLIRCTYCVHRCFYIVLTFEKYMHVITFAINFYNCIYNYTVYPSFTPKPTLKRTHTTKPAPLNIRWDLFFFFFLVQGKNSHTIILKYFILLLLCRLFIKTKSNPKVFKFTHTFVFDSVIIQTTNCINTINNTIIFCTMYIFIKKHIWTTLHVQCHWVTNMICLLFDFQMQTF